MTVTTLITSVISDAGRFTVLTSAVYSSMACLMTYLAIVYFPKSNNQLTVDFIIQCSLVNNNRSDKQAAASAAAVSDNTASVINVCVITMPTATPWPDLAQALLHSLPDIFGHWCP